MRLLSLVSRSQTASSLCTVLYYCCTTLYGTTNVQQYMLAVFTLHSFYLQFLNLKMMGCALNVQIQLMMNTGWHVTSATCGSCTDLDESPLVTRRFTENTSQSLFEQSRSHDNHVIFRWNVVFAKMAAEN